MKRVLILLCSCILLQSCGGGGGNDSGPDLGTSWQPGVFDASTRFDGMCANPRSGNDPDGNPWPDVQGSATDEKNWLRSWTHELYLWYDEVPDLDPSTGTSVPDYFDLMRTDDTTPSGADKDKFHFTYDTDDWIALSQTGTSAGYGLTWSVPSNVPPRQYVVAYTDPDTSATDNGVTRGEQVVSIDGVSIDANDDAGIEVLNEGLFPEVAGQSHEFVFRELDGSTRTVTLTSENVVSTPVQNAHVIDSGGEKVGYLLFNDHIATAEPQLAAAIAQLQAAGPIDDLVIDIRYNGGGYLAIASELAYMVAGDAQTSGRTFEQLEFNDQYSDTNPVTGEPLDPEPFHATTQGFSGASGQALPALNLTRVFILTGAGTCSASESIINGLRGIDVEVIQIGSTTCGKPYGFYPTDNCGTTYFSIQFRGVNAKGFGDYPDGFSPQNTTHDVGVTLPGCSVADDFSHALGDSAEDLLAEALQYRTSGTCSVPPSGVAPKRVQAQSVSDGGKGLKTAKGPWLENRILSRPQRTH